MRTCLAAVGVLMIWAGSARAADTFAVQPVAIPDQKAVFATVESPRVVPARVRTGGTIVRLAVREGDQVMQGEVVAVLADEKLSLQANALDAEIAGLKAQLTQAEADLGRAEPLFKGGFVAKSRMDELRTAVSVAANALKARTSARSVLDQQMAEGKVFAPTDGRVLKVPVAEGSVAMAGEAVAIVANGDVIVRLSVPERHARFLKVGDPVRLDGEDITEGLSGAGEITLIYPEIEDGRVTADAKVAGLSDRFVGQRVRVWISTGARRGFVIPEHFVTVRFGLDYVTLRRADGSTAEVPVQRGQPQSLPDIPDGLEILSGLRAGDVLVRP